MILSALEIKITSSSSVVDPVYTISIYMGPCSASRKYDFKKNCVSKRVKFAVTYRFFMAREKLYKK